MTTNHDLLRDPTVGYIRMAPNTKVVERTKCCGATPKRNIQMEYICPNCYDTLTEADIELTSAPKDDDSDEETEE